MRLFWLAVLAAHGTAAVAWWWLMPAGFPVESARFWVNQVVPWVGLVLVVGTRFLWWEMGVVRQGVFAGLAGFWLAVAVAARVVFPVSAAAWFLAPLVIGVGMGAAVMVGRPWRDRWAGVGVVAGVGLGTFVVWAERGRDPDTRPVAGEVVFPEALQAPEDARAVVMSADVKVDPGEAVATVTSGRMMLNVQPLLTFVARSPDRCWTLFAPKALRDGPVRKLLHLERVGERLVLGHRDDNRSVTEFVARDGGLEIDSWTQLPAAVYSHLNTFNELTIMGHRKLAVSFSPCPGERIEFRPFSIQGESPGRAAYLDAEGNFKVVQARKGEKGPFATLASGKLARGEPLGMVLYDQGRAVFEVTLEDWSAQCGVQASPTAGWGLPVNAIEFSLDGDSDRAAGGMWITLAATSVGRGWDTVGHGAGAYRNRVKVRVVR